MLFPKSLKRYIAVLLPCATITLSLAACNPTKKPTEEKTQTAHTPVSSTNFLYNFWENYNFNDSTAIKDTNQMEQRLVDFIAAFPRHPIEQVREAIQHMLQKTESNPATFTYFKDKYAHYLYNPNSPFRSDWYYEPILEYLISSSNSTETERIRYKMQLNRVRKNQPGTTATDFQYLTSTGQKERLHHPDHMAKLIIFYDPACPHCKKIMEILKTSPLLNSLVTKKQIRIIAIDPMGDQVLWKDYQINIPENWTNGFDDQGILINKQMYNLAAYPTLYFIDSDNKVVLKDPDYQYLLNFLQQVSVL